MSLRISFGYRWVEINVLNRMVSGMLIVLSVDCGNCSTRNLINWVKR